MALLDADKALVKEYGITDIHELSKDEKVEFLDAQLETLRTTLWRLRVDFTVLTATEADGKNEEEEKETKLKTFKNDIRRMAEAITRFEALKSEL